MKELDHWQLRSMIPWVSAQPHTWPLFPLPAFLSYIPTPFTCQIHGITNLNQVDIEENIEFGRLPIHYKCVSQDWIDQKLSSPNVASGRVAKTGAPAPSPVSPSTVGSLENIIRGPSPAQYVLMLLLDCRIPLKALTCDDNRCVGYLWAAKDTYQDCCNCLPKKKLSGRT